MSVLGSCNEGSLMGPGETTVWWACSMSAKSAFLGGPSREPAPSPPVSVAHLAHRVRQSIWQVLENLQSYPWWRVLGSERRLRSNTRICWSFSFSFWGEGRCVRGCRNIIKLIQLRNREVPLRAPVIRRVDFLLALFQGFRVKERMPSLLLPRPLWRGSGDLCRRPFVLLPEGGVRGGGLM